MYPDRIFLNAMLSRVVDFKRVLEFLSMRTSTTQLLLARCSCSSSETIQTHCFSRGELCLDFVEATMKVTQSAYSWISRTSHDLACGRNEYRWSQRRSGSSEVGNWGDVSLQCSTIMIAPQRATLAGKLTIYQPGYRSITLSNVEERIRKSL